MGPRPALLPSEERALEALARHGSRKRAAHALGVSYNTLKHQVWDACQKLGVETELQAFAALGRLT